MTSDIDPLKASLASCRLCAERFAATATSHTPRPWVWFDRSARILIASQAPGRRVHEAPSRGWDRSGVRLREWMGVDPATFADTRRIAVVPMGFCFPGQGSDGADLKPPAICAATWRQPVLEALDQVRLTLVVGAVAQRWHLGAQAVGGVTATVARWRTFGPAVVPLPHPSWRTRVWERRNPWFATDLLPVLRERVQQVLR